MTNDRLVRKLCRTTLPQSQAPDDLDAFVETVVKTYPSVDAEVFLDVIDFLLHELVSSARLPDGTALGQLFAAVETIVGPGAEAKKLHSILTESGSAWGVGIVSGRYGLVRRQLSGIEEELDHTIAAAPHEAGVHLSDAWKAVTRRPLDPAKACDEAIRAVEVVVKPVVLPNQGLLTLGKAIGELNTGPGRWTSNLSSKEENGAVHTVTSMCRLLWESHDTVTVGSEKSRRP